MDAMIHNLAASSMLTESMTTILSNIGKWS